jgi:hypothetical protein
VPEALGPVQREGNGFGLQICHDVPRKRAGAHEPGVCREGQRRKRAANAVSLLSDRGG